MSASSVFLFTFIFLFACGLLYKEGILDKNSRLIALIFFLTIAFAVRLPLMSHSTTDYEHFLAQWVQHFRIHGFEGLATIYSNYNVPYLYILALFACIPMDDMYLIKCLSIFFDVILAWSASKIVLYYTRSKNKQAAAFILVMLLPTVVLNGACWGQCDSIFASFCLLAFYHGVQGKGKLSYLHGALALAFKVQAVFLLPVYGVLLLMNKIKLKDAWIFPLVFVGSLLPAVAAGRPFMDALTIYIDQVGGTTSSLNFNSASIYALIPYGYEADWLLYADAIGIALAIAIVYTTLLWPYARYKSVTKHTLFGFGCMLALGIPMVLPHMHERYFFLGDIFTLMLGVISPIFAPAALLCQFGSLLGYHAYLKNEFLLLMNNGTYAMLAAFLLICIYTHKTYKLNGEL